MRNLKFLFHSKQSWLYLLICIVFLVILIIYSNIGIDFELYKNKNYDILGVLFLIFLSYYMVILNFDET